MFVVAAGLGTREAKSQLVTPPDLFVSGMRSPQFPPAGDWAEVVTVTSKWLVIQNQSGQQFPIALDSIAQFVLRWPISPEAITGTALVETTGIDLGSNQIRTDHVDVFEGAARLLVRPIMQQVIGFNRRPTAFDIQNQNNYGVYIPLLPGEDQIPNRLHVCGPVAGGNPLRIAVAGNNSVAVYPGGTGLFFSQVTAGSAGLLRQHDLVYVVPTDVTPKSLILGQMVGYKKIPLSQFVP
ncbi:MAG: hypothetical protein JWN86_2388 [Planctomycetota bacterium]|nr:hypothetical protein [Planctomycetota bacterium]